MHSSSSISIRKSSVFAEMTERPTSMRPIVRPRRTSPELLPYVNTPFSRIKNLKKIVFYNSNVKTWEVSSSRLELRLTLRQITFVPFVPAFQRPLSFLGKVPFQLLRLDVVRCARFKGCQNFPFRIFPASLARMFLLFTGGRIGVTLNSIHCDSLGRPPPWGIRLGHFFK